MSRFVTSGAVAALLLFLAGCGSDKPVPPPDYGSEDGLKIAQLVSEFNDAIADTARFKKIFAGTAPANLKDYRKYVYEVVVGSPKVTGAEATASVTVQVESNREVVAKVEWTFTKVGDAWKIKTAPLR